MKLPALIILFAVILIIGNIVPSYSIDLRKTIEIKPGYAIPFRVELSQGEKLQGEFEFSSGKEILFWVEDPRKKIVVPKEKVPFPGKKISFTAPKEGIYSFIFQNLSVKIGDNQKVTLILGSPEPESTGGGGCLIATATYGTELAPQVQKLRELRDSKLLQTNSGFSFISVFNQLYYSFSPMVADFERKNLIFKEVVKVTITPLVNSLLLLNYIDMDSEAKVLGYGMGIIALNMGMYFIAPAIVIWKIKKRF